jgi:hypothetical protein
VWEVQWGRDGYKGTPKVMDLKGHKSQVGALPVFDLGFHCKLALTVIFMSAAMDLKGHGRQANGCVVTARREVCSCCECSVVT